MDPLSAAAFAIRVLNLADSAIKAGGAVYDRWQASRDHARTMLQEKRDPTTEEWDYLNESIATHRDQLHSDTK